MTSILPKFLRNARIFPEGGVVDEFEAGRKDREARGIAIVNNMEPPSAAFEAGAASLAEAERYRRQPRDLRLKGELHRQRNSLAEEEINLVNEINDRLVKLQATRKAIRAIDAAGKVIVEDEKPYTPVQSAVQNKMPASENTRKLEHTAIVDGKAVTEEIEIDEADLAREIGDYAKAC